MDNKIKELLNKKAYGFSDLCSIMEILRSDNGCPWDMEQTHKSIRNNFIEEVYEAVEAIDTDDVPLLREELGDVLLQVVFHSRISEEAGEFDIGDVVSEVCVKLIERHPHIFSDVKVAGTDEVLLNWDNIKQNKKGRETIQEKLDGVSKSLPALMRAAKLAKKADFSPTNVDIDPNEKMIGEALFNIAAYAQLHNIDAEQALYCACENFIKNIMEN